jgi:hypothetical protein
MAMVTTDVEDVYHVLRGSAVLPMQAGNCMWRSPEAHAEEPIISTCDMFTFGLVISPGDSVVSDRGHSHVCTYFSCQFRCICAVTNRVLLAFAKSELEEGEELLPRITSSQISYLVDADDVPDPLNHLQGNS